MDLNELIVAKQAKTTELNNLITVGETEKRELSDLETAIFNLLKSEIRDLETQIIAKNSTNKVTINNERKMSKKFSLREALYNELNRTAQPEHIQSVLTEARNSFVSSGCECKGIQIPFQIHEERDLSISGAGSASTGLVANELPWGILAPLRNKLVTLKAGAQYLNLSSNVSLGSYSVGNAFWENETDAAGAGDGTFSVASMKPHRLTSYINISKQLLAQADPSVETFLINQLVAEIANKLEATIWGNQASVATAPDGFFTGVAVGSYVTTGASSYAKVIAYEQALETANINDYKFIISPKLKGILKQCPKSATASNAGFVYQDGAIDGVETLVTGFIPTVNTTECGVIAGDFSQLLIGSFAGIDLTIDPYTMSKYGMIQVVVNSYWDVLKSRTAAFVVGSLA